MDIGRGIHRARKYRRVSQKQLYEQIGVSAHLMRFIEGKEAHRKLTYSLISSILEALSVPMDIVYMLGDEGLSSENREYLQDWMNKNRWV